MKPEIDLLYKEAGQAEKAHDFEKALEVYQKIIQKDPAEEQAYYGTSNMYAIRGMVPQVVTQYIKLAEMFEGKGQLDAALDACQWVIRVDPTSAQPRLKLISILEKQGNKERVFQESTALSRIFSALGQGEQSVQLMEKLRELDPGNISLSLQMGEIYIRQGQILEGLSLYKSIAKQLLELKDYAKAIDVLKRIKVIKYNDLENLESLGQAYMELGKLDEAKTEFRQMLRQDLNHIRALAQLGLIAKSQGQWDEARVPFRKIVELDPENAFAREHFAEVMEMFEEHAEAIKYYLTAAQIYVREKELEKGIEVYQNVLALDQDNRQAREQLEALGASLTAKKRVRGAAVEAAARQSIAKMREKPLEVPRVPVGEAPGAYVEEPFVQAASSLPESSLPQNEQEKPAAAFAKRELEVSFEGEGSAIEEQITPSKPTKPILMHPRGSLAPEKSILGGKSLLSRPKASSPETKPLIEAKASSLAEVKAPPAEVKAPPAEVKAPPAEVKALAAKEKVFELSSREMAASLGMPELEKLIAQNQIGHAIQYSKEALNTTPEGQELKFLLGKLYYENNFLEEALSLFKELSREAQNSKVLGVLSDLYLLLGQGEAWADSVVQWAKLELNQGNGEGALEAVLRVLALNPKHILARKLLVSLLKNKNLESMTLYHHRLLRETLEAVRAISELIPLYKEILEIKPAAVSIREKLALCYQETGMAMEAKQEFLFLSSHYRTEGELGREADSLERVLALDPSDRVVMFRLKDVYALLGKKEASLRFELRLGEAELEKGNLDTALESYKRVLEEYPENEVAMSHALEIQLKQEKFKEAVEMGEKLAAFYVKQENPEKAGTVYKDLLKLESENLILHQGLANLYAKMGRNKEAIQEYMIQGHVATKQAFFDEAINAYRQVIALDGSFKDARYQLGVLYADHKNNLDGALVEFKKVRSLDSHHKAALSRLAKGHAVQGDMETALEYTRELLHLDPASANLVEELFRDAETRLQQEPEDQRLHFNIGLLYKERGKLDDAIREFQTVIRKSPERTLRAYLYQGLCWEAKALQEKEDALYQTAVKVYKKGMEIKGHQDEEYLDLKYSLARLYESLGKVQEALVLYQEIVAVDMEHKDSRDRKKRLDEEISSGKVTRIPRKESG